MTAAVELFSSSQLTFNFYNRLDRSGNTPYQDDSDLRIRRIYNALKRNLPSIRLEGFFQFTKTDRSYCNALLHRDFQLDNQVHSMIETQIGWNQVLQRFESQNTGPDCIRRPDHYAAHVVSGVGSVASGKNIFLFFPDCIKSKTAHKPFGIELIDVWENIFNQVVFPATKRVFNAKNNLAISKININQTIFLASLLHELGHQVGPFKLTQLKSKPAHSSSEANNFNYDLGLTKDSAPDAMLDSEFIWNSDAITPFFLDILGELSTDSFMAHQFPEFPHLAQFVLLQRLFWFTRRGFMDNPISANLNTDNDSWIGAYLWNEAFKKNLLLRENSGLRLNTDQLPSFFENIYSELKALEQELMSLPTKEHRDQKIFQWMRSKVDYDETSGFYLSRETQSVFTKLTDLPEVPHFQTLI